MKSLRSLLSALVVALFTAGCAFDGGTYPQSSLDPTSDFATVSHDLFMTTVWWSVVVLTVVWVALAYILVRFRERPDSPRPKQVHGHMGLEIAWTIGPALIVVAITVPTIQAVFSTQQPDPDAMVVDVIGHQFWWEFRYPDSGLITANEVHIPVDRPVSFRISSADVIHSFWVPLLGGKRDANPLRARPEGQDLEYNWIHLTADETGTFWGQCAEFCGDSHSLMGFRVVVENMGDFEAWQAALAEPVVAPAVADSAASEQAVTAPTQAAASDPLVEQGREIFHAQTCIACHAIEGTNAQGVIAPNLTLLGRRSSIAAGWLENTPENLERWITAPQSVKPGALMPGVALPGGNWPATNLTEDQVRAVAAYLYSLR